jgi:hypothetical protein
MGWRSWLTIGSSLLLSLSAPGVARAEEAAWTVSDVHQAILDASNNTGVPHARLWRIVACETGRTFDPWSIGDKGTSFGPIQLHVGGGEITRYRAAYPGRSLYDPYATVEFLATAILDGRAASWSCR